MKPVFSLTLLSSALGAVIYPVCFEEQIKEILNVDHLEPPSEFPTGIKVVFVYANGPQETEQNTFQDEVGDAGHHQDGKHNGHILEATTTITATRKGKLYTSTVAMTTTATTGLNGNTPLTNMHFGGPTTTSTIFTASATPQSSSFTSQERLSTKQRNPLALGGDKVSRRLEHSINIATITDGIAFTNAPEPTTGTKQQPLLTTKISLPSKAQLADSLALKALTGHISSASSTEKVTRTTGAPFYITTSSVVRLSHSSLSSGRYLNSSRVIQPASSLIFSQSLLAATSSLLALISSSTVSNSSSLALPSSSVTSLTNSTASLVQTSSVSSTTPSSSSPHIFRVFAASSNANGFTGDLFKAISTYAVSGNFPRKQLPLKIPSGVSNSDKYQTNKFYVNLFLGDQTNMIWSYPYGMQFLKSTYYGWAVQHTIPQDKVFGNVNSNNNNPSYYFNPTNIKEMVFSAVSFKSNLQMTVSNMKVMSALVKLGLATNYIEVPVVQGMGFVTSIYHGNLVPQLNSAVGFKTVVKESSSNLKSNILKFRATLFSGTQYLIYVTFPSGQSTSGFSFSVPNSYAIKANKNIDGLQIQIAVAPSSSQDKFYDQSAGMYVTESKIKGHGYGGTRGEYIFAYGTKGSSTSGKPIVFLLPHHVELIDSTTKNAATGITLASTTKGNMAAYLTNSVVLQENLNYNIQFLPWVQEMGATKPFYTSNQLKLIAQVANSELSVDIKRLVLSMNSNYYSGKVLDKYAYILLVVSDIIGNEALAKSTLKILKDTFAVFTTNKQFYPLMYDTKFGGITSTASQGGDTGVEFGSAYYNDHHFHYGYFVHAAAVIGYVDKKYGGTWYKDQQFWVNALIRDVANPSPDDKQFPIFRMFDWFTGHSWASGLFAGADGRNEESSSEDYNFAYGMKLWGKVSGNQRMESTGDLMLAVMKRSMNKYMYYSSSNSVEPSQILPNKVSGILFDNKIDYTTYFGTPKDHPEYVHGIHMLPITPASSLIRGSAYVKEEWQQQITTFISKVSDGWAGILRLNQALYDAASSYAFFSSSSWSPAYLDNGQSRTWSLAFSAGVSNALA